MPSITGYETGSQLLNPYQTTISSISGNKFTLDVGLYLDNGSAISSDNRLPVDAQLTVGDIEIGAVELKDATTDTRQKVKSDGVDNAAVVTQNSQPLPTGAATSANQELLLETKVESNEGDNIRTSNVNQEILLSSILKEIKKMNLHLSILTDNDIKNSEVE